MKLSIKTSKQMITKINFNPNFKKSIKLYINRVK